MLNPTEFLISDKKVFSDDPAGLWGGLKPVYVTQISKFVFAGSFYRDVNLIYARFLERLGIDPEKALRFELRGFKTYECMSKYRDGGSRWCGVDSIHIPIVECGSYHPHVSHRHVCRVVSQLMERIEFIEDHTPADYLIKLDLTVPGWVSKSLRPDDLKRIRLAIRIFLEKLQPLLFHHKSRLGGFYTIHVWKTTKPLDPHLHVHFNLLNVAWNPQSKTFHRFKPWISEQCVKRAWRDALKSVGFWDDPCDTHYPDCHVGYFRLADRSRLVHRIKYCFRKPLVDLNEFIGNCDLSRVDQAWARYLLHYTPRRFYAGWMLRLGKFGFNSSKLGSLRCPICGDVLRFLGFQPEVSPDVPWLTLDRRGNLVCSTYFI